MRLVLDTNVVLGAAIAAHKRTSGMENTSTALDLLDALRGGQFVAVTSRPLMTELREVLSRPKLVRKHGMRPTQLRAFISGIRKASLVVSGRPRPRVPELARRDPKDIKVLAVAFNGAADAIVTLDLDLLDMRGTPALRGVGVLRPGEALRALRS